jgi:hypothetical protein
MAYISKVIDGLQIQEVKEHQHAKIEESIIQK